MGGEPPLKRRKTDSKSDNDAYEKEDEEATTMGGTRGVAFGALLREQRKKNKALLTNKLKECAHKHPIFCQIYILDMLADFAALFFPEYAKLPDQVQDPVKLHMNMDFLVNALSHRRNARRYCDATTKRGVAFWRQNSATFWEAVPFILAQMEIGQLGFFRRKGYGASDEFSFPFVVVWKHPSCNDEQEEVPIIGVIFPHMTTKETVKEVHYAGVPPAGFYPGYPAYSHKIVEKNKEFGADLGSPSALYETCCETIRSGYLCRCARALEEPYEHSAGCPVYNAAKMGVQQILTDSGSNLSLLQPPQDGYYKVHYFAFWDQPSPTPPPPPPPPPAIPSADGEKKADAPAGVDEKKAAGPAKQRKTAKNAVAAMGAALAMAPPVAEKDHHSMLMSLLCHPKPRRKAKAKNNQAAAIAEGENLVVDFENQSGSEVSNDGWYRRVKIFKNMDPLSCHFATEKAEVDKIEAPKIFPIHLLDPKQALLHKLPFHFDPYTADQHN